MVEAQFIVYWKQNKEIKSQNKAKQAKKVIFMEKSLNWKVARSAELKSFCTKARRMFVKYRKKGKNGGKNYRL